MNEIFKTKNDIAWEQIFANNNVLESIDRNGRFIISASEIKKYREPRLMVKFDHREDRPEIFTKNNLSILPITRGDYVISNFRAYHTLEHSSQPINRLLLPENLQSLDENNINSEAIAINCAFASGIFNHFLDEDELVPTVSGRMSSGKFNFVINNRKLNCMIGVDVNQSQIEIDAAFEGGYSLALIEAKLDISNDFLIRQLYYPFRTWQSSGKITKHIRPVFMTYSNGIFNLYEYSFSKPESYNSLELVQAQRYTIENCSITIEDLKMCMSNIQIEMEPAVPFPQANNFKRVINLCELINIHEMDSVEVTDEYDFDVRQTRYYTDAGRYLGLIDSYIDETQRRRYCLTTAGKQIMRLKYRDRQLSFCRAILKHRIFNNVFSETIDMADVPSVGRISAIMKKSNLYHIESQKTFDRRASTIRSWIQWMIELTQE